ncbi:MAG: preprotein translocase subunit SecG [Candidatus Paceibacterota bacterium]|jgi:preprotein translocase subunit SecG
MNNLLIAQSIISVLLVILILLQQRGTALGSAFGGGGEVYSTRRGIQKKLMYATIVLVVAFLVMAVLNLLS